MSGPLTADPIVHAAIVRFARDGFDAPLRTIADDAGVSAALLIKRFGSKSGLRDACDEVVLAAVRAVKNDNLRAASSGQLLTALTTSDQHAPVVAYAMQSVKRGGALGRQFVEHMIDDAVQYTADAVEQGVVRPSRDERARVRYLVMSAFGAFLLTTLLDPQDDPADLPGLLHRLQSETMLPMLELFTEGLFTSRQMLDEYLLYVGDPPGTATSPQADRDDPA